MDIEIDNQAAGAVGDDDDPQYIVDKIINKRVVGKNVQYYISWLGYGKHDNCWVAKSDICPKEVKEFERKLKLKKAAKKSRRPSMKGKRAPNRAVVLGSDPGRCDQEVVVSGTVGNLPKGWSKIFGGSSGRDGDSQVVYQLSTGFARGLQPEKILAIGSHEETGMTMVRMKWKDIQRPEFVPYQEAKEKCPQVLISYFQESTSWVPQSFWAKDD